MKKTVLCVVLCLALSNAWAQDGCATALPIVAGTYAVTAVNGPEIPNPICALNGLTNVTASEWYTYTPAEDLALTITTGVGAIVDTRFHVYSGVCGALVCVGGDDDSGPSLSSIATINVSGGVTYHIAFDNRWSSMGFQFQLIENEISNAAVSFTPTALPGAGNVLGVVDMNGDMLDDAVAPTQNNVNIVQQTETGFITLNIPTSAAVNTPSWSMAAGDLDDNGYTDLLYGGGSGLTIMMASDDGMGFTQHSPGQYIFCQRTNMVDINNDGHLDVYSCHDVAANVYYLFDGDVNFEYHQGGLGETCGNYGSIWIDYDNDHDLDLFVAKCGCDPVDILYRNNGDGTFTNMAATAGFVDSHQSWSSAWGDYDNDGDMDVLIGSSSSGYQKLMQNNGNGTFTNITAGSGFDLFTGQSIEWTTHDFNNDGYLDVLGGTGLMVNNGDMTFSQVAGNPQNGPIGDLNNDGFLDIVNATTCYMNNGNENNYIKIYPVGTVSNKNGIGARVQVTSALGTQIRDVKAGDGFRYMSSITAHFGLGADTEVTEVVVYWPSGLVQQVANPDINSILEIVEGVSTGVDDHI
ncbi:MAG: CRTAC1 family protein, partial [Flavobacteriales bacterium]